MTKYSERELLAFMKKSEARVKKLTDMKAPDLLIKREKEWLKQLSEERGYYYGQGSWLYTPYRIPKQ